MKKRTSSGLIDIVRTFKNQYLSLIGFSAISNILMLAPAWYMLQVYDRVLTSQDDNTLLGLTLIIVFLYVIYASLERYRGLVLIGISELIDEKVADRLHSSILKPESSQRQKILGSLNDLNTVKQFFTGQPVLAFLDAPWFLIYLSIIFLMHVSLGLVAIFSALILFVLALINQRVTSHNLAESQTAFADERRLVSNAMLSADSIQVMGMRSVVRANLRKIRISYLDNLLIASTNGVNLSSISKFFRIVIQSATLGFGAYLAIRHEISAGMIIAASILLGRVLAPIEGIINSWKQLAEFRKAFSNLDEILKSNPEQQHTVVLGRPAGNLQLHNVTLRLREHGKPTLDEINLTVNAGETLAVIGPSGAGKTSLLKTLAGIYKPHQGQSSVDGTDLAFRDLDELGMFMGYLGQSTELMAGKISENIARFGPIDSAQVLDAAKRSGAHEVILTLPEGYETVLGDNGYGLSEGQKRKIGLARAIYKQPAIILLDEPAAGLDDASLAKVIESIKFLKTIHVTVVFTTHRPSLAHLADKVAVLNDGKLRIYGSRDEVFASLNQKINAK